MGLIEGVPVFSNFLNLSGIKIEIGSQFTLDDESFVNISLVLVDVLQREPSVVVSGVVQAVVWVDKNSIKDSLVSNLVEWTQISVDSCGVHEIVLGHHLVNSKVLDRLSEPDVYNVVKHCNILSPGFSVVLAEPSSKSSLVNKPHLCVEITSI